MFANRKYSISQNFFSVSKGVGQTQSMIWVQLPQKPLNGF